MSSFESRNIDRRTFLFAGFAAAVCATAQIPRLETLTQWLNASRKTRELALQPCLDRIREMDSTIHAWVQVLPQRSTGNGKLSEIPFGVKDIIETRGRAAPHDFLDCPNRIVKIKLSHYPYFIVLTCWHSRC